MQAELAFEHGALVGRAGADVEDGDMIHALLIAQTPRLATKKGEKGAVGRGSFSGGCFSCEALLWYNYAMTPKLSDELRQALSRHPGEPVQVEDPVSHARYVIVQLDAYEQLQRAVDYDASDPDPRSFYPAFAEAVKDDLDAPGMELYDGDAAPRNGP